MEILYKGKKDFNEIEELIKSNEDEKYDLDFSGANGIIVHGDNFHVMSNLLKRFENKIDLIYIDPPFNTNSRFFYNKNRVSTISAEKSSELAYSDNMDLEKYLEFIRERLYIMRKLLSNKGTLYFHIDLKVGHYIKLILDEIFGADNYVNDITRIKSNPKNFARNAYGNEKDVIFVYSKQPKKNIFNNVKQPLDEKEIVALFPKIDENGERYTTVPCHAPGETLNGVTGKEWKGMLPPKGRHWRSSPDELDKLDKDGKIEWSKTGNPRIKKYAKDHEGKKIQDIWKYKDPQYPIYPTEKNSDMLNMIVRQSSLEGSVIMDCFCGSGSFLKAGLLNGRKVIGIDSSEVSYKVCNEQPEFESLLKIDF